MKKMLLVLALLTIAGVEAKGYEKKPTKMMKKGGRTLQMNKMNNMNQTAPTKRPAVLGKDSKTYTPNNLPQPKVAKAAAKRKAARR